MTGLPPTLRPRLFVQMDASDLQTWSRHPLSRNDVLDIRDERSLDALIALLALSREAQAMTAHLVKPTPVRTWRINGLAEAIKFLAPCGGSSNSWGDRVMAR
jgi:hypothetical protein